MLSAIADQGFINSAWSDEEWTVDGAAVRVSVVCFSQSERGAILDGKEVDVIFPDLTGHGAATDLTKAVQLKQNEQVAYQGTISYGPFEIDGKTARDFLTAPSK